MTVWEKKMSHICNNLKRVAHIDLFAQILKIDQELLLFVNR
jgi:hypothetical protein